MSKFAGAVALLLVASACSGGAETTTPAPSTTTAAPTTTSTTTTLAPTATLPTTTTPPTTTVAAIAGDWIADLLADLEVSDITPQVDYSRDDWGSWIDADGDCINTRHEVLIRESLVEVEMDPSGCKVVSGRWFGPQYSASTTYPSLIDIYHFVPLCHAHASGGWAWSRATKRDYNNDLSDPLHLTAHSTLTNRSQGCKGLDGWLPPDFREWCQFAHTWVNIKDRWGLTATGSETAKLQLILGTCDEPSTDSTSVEPAPTVAPTTTTSGVHDNPGNTKNCSDFSTYPEAKAWFDTYLPYYGDVARLDGDDDGEPCESLPGGP